MTGFFCKCTHFESVLTNIFFFECFDLVRHLQQTAQEHF